MNQQARARAASLTNSDTQSARRYRNESNVKLDLSQLLDTMGYGPVENEHTIPGGSIDIYVPHHRVIIETKARGLASDPHKPQGSDRESAKGQLDRYVLNEIREELGSFNWGPDDRSDRPWIGVVTDGRRWHSWRYAHADEPEIESLPATTADDASALLARIENDFGKEHSGRQWVPAQPAKLFQEHASELEKVYRDLPPDRKRTTNTKRELWLDMLQVSGITPDKTKVDELFVTHSLLIAIARLVMRTLTTDHGEWTQALKDGFVSWITDSRTGTEWADGLRTTIAAHDWKRRRQDVLQSVYMTFVSATDRKVFGEYYTPDWLAALIVDEALDDAWLQASIEHGESAVRRGRRVEGRGVLDPTCGSGTFLYHAARQILKAPAMQELTPTQQSDVTTSLVHGIDVHPVAIEIAKTNLMRALPAPPARGNAALQVRMGDSLIASDDGKELFDVGGTMRIVTPKGRNVFLPMGFVRQHGFSDDMRRVVTAAVEKRPVPEPVLEALETGDRKRLEEARDALALAIDHEGNSVWTWYAVNIAAPRLLAEQKVDRIVANPPWVKLSEIQYKPRKRAMEKLGAELKVSEGGKQAPHTDIAAYFIRRTRELYLREPGKNPGVWLVKKSSLKAGHWQAFREEHRSTLAQSVDLEDLQPFGGGDARRCCLLLEHHTMAGAPAGLRLKGIRRTEKKTSKPVARPKPDEAPEAVRKRIEFVTAGTEAAPTPSGYRTATGKAVFHQGATVLPHVLTIAERAEPATSMERVRVTTRKSTKAPWNGVRPRTIEVPSHWLVEMCTSPTMTAFSNHTIRAIMPLDTSGRLLTEREIDEDGWKLLDEVYQSHAAAGKQTPQTLLERIDYQRNLSIQLPLRPETQRKLVLYPKSGDRMRAARYRCGHAVVDHGLYWYRAHTQAEAGYLTVLLNASCLEEAYRNARESGRDFHLQPWHKIPIPRFDRKNPMHQEIGRLCTRAERVAEQAMTGETQERGQVSRSKAVRQALAAAGLQASMNELARELLPEHAAN